MFNRYTTTQSEEYTEIWNYFERTRPSKESKWTVSIQKIFALDKEGEEREYLKQLSNRTLLWYGARITNYAKILSQGFKFQTKCQIDAYKYGRGITFYDMVASVAPFCFATESMNEGYLMICEVALGMVEKSTVSNDGVIYFPKDSLRYCFLRISLALFLYESSIRGEGLSLVPETWKYMDGDYRIPTKRFNPKCGMYHQKVVIWTLMRRNDDEIIGALWQSLHGKIDEPGEDEVLVKSQIFI